MRIEGISQVSPIKNVEAVGEGFSNKNANDKSQETLNSGQTQEQREVSEEDVIQAIESANKKIEIYDTRLEFSIHEETKEIMVKIIDKNDEVIKEIPPEKILDMVAGLMELAGIIVDEKA